MQRSARLKAHPVSLAHLAFLDVPQGMDFRGVEKSELPILGSAGC